MRKACLLLSLGSIAWGCGNPESEPSDSALLLEAELDSAQATAANSDAAPYAEVLRRCFAETAKDEPGVEVHAIGQYLALGDAMLAVHVPIPEASNLAHCIEAAVADEAPPGAPNPGNAFSSGSFAIDLGGPPQPLRPGDFERHFDAHQRGLEHMVRDVVARGALPADHFFVREVLEGL